MSVHFRFKDDLKVIYHFTQHMTRWCYFIIAVVDVFRALLTRLNLGCLYHDSRSHTSDYVYGCVGGAVSTALFRISLIISLISSLIISLISPLIISLIRSVISCCLLIVSVWMMTNILSKHGYHFCHCAQNSINELPVFNGHLQSTKTSYYLSRTCTLIGFT